jgi:hypothetical protein
MTSREHYRDEAAANDQELLRITQEAGADLADASPRNDPDAITLSVAWLVEVMQLLSNEKH